MSWKKTDRLMDTIRHYASFPATGVSLHQMVQFGERPSVGASCLILTPSPPPSICSYAIACFADRPPASCAATGTLFRASQFLAEELPIRLAHRVQELDNLPDGLNEMPSVRKVLDWYAQSFEVRPCHADIRIYRFPDVQRAREHPPTPPPSPFSCLI